MHRFSDTTGAQTSAEFLKVAENLVLSGSEPIVWPRCSTAVCVLLLGADRISDETKTFNPLPVLQSLSGIVVRQLEADDLYGIPMRLMPEGRRELMRIGRDRESETGSQVDAAAAGAPHLQRGRTCGLQQLLRQTPCMRVVLFRGRIKRCETAYQTLLSGGKAQGVLPPSNAFACLTLEETR